MLKKMTKCIVCGADFMKKDNQKNYSNGCSEKSLKKLDQTPKRKEWRRFYMDKYQKDPKNMARAMTRRQQPEAKEERKKYSHGYNQRLDVKEATRLRRLAPKYQKKLKLRRLAPKYKEYQRLYRQDPKNKEIRNKQARESYQKKKEKKENDKS